MLVDDVGGPWDAATSSLLGELVELSLLLPSGDLRETLHKVADLAVRHVAADLQVGVTLVRDGRAFTGVWVGEDVRAVDGAQYDSDGPCVDAVRTRATHEIADLRIHERWREFAASAVSHGLRSSLSVPLLAGGESLGALNVYAGQPHAFDERSRVVAATLANCAAAALVNGRAYAEARRAIVTLQRDLLPRDLPQVPGFGLAVRYLPATEGTNVGGDWYDACPAEAGSLSVSIGDVGGHGLKAASIMGQIRVGLRAYTLEGHAPTRALDLLHQLFSDLEPDTIATVCALHLAEAGPRIDVSWATAGHPPPLVIRPSGDVFYLDGEVAAPLGAPVTAARAGQHAALARGSTLVLFTDGLVERRGRSLDDGLQLLAEAASGAPRDLEALCDALLDALLGESEQQDDIALLAVSLPG